MIPVDTATLAAHLARTPAQVRHLVAEGLIAPIGRWRTGRVGRPSMWFDLDQVDDLLRACLTGNSPPDDIGT